jgi:CRP/FNR family transcriptional regulator, cyclic AMP receptor protein
MDSLLTLTQSQPTLTLEAGDTLIAQGAAGGDLFILEDGQLVVERDGVKIATLSRPGSLVGDMSVVLGRASSATVRAERGSTVRVIRAARAYLEQNPQLAMSIAEMMANRLDATSALLVELTQQHGGKVEQGLLSRILSALHVPAEFSVVERHDMFGGAEDSLRD